jgi:hypothetical protein
MLGILNGLLLDRNDVKLLVVMMMVRLETRLVRVLHMGRGGLLALVSFFGCHLFGQREG